MEDIASSKQHQKHRPREKKNQNKLHNTKEQMQRNMIQCNTNAITMQQSAFKLDEYLPRMVHSYLDLMPFSTAALPLPAISETNKLDSKFLMTYRPNQKFNQQQLKNFTTCKFSYLIPVGQTYKHRLKKKILTNLNTYNCTCANV